MINSQIFSLNGNEYRTNAQVTLLDLINYTSDNSDLIVFEYNNKIIRKDKWNDIIINDNDIIEMITIVGGG